MHKLLLVNFMNKNKILKTLFIFLPFLLAFPFHFVYDYIKFPFFAIYFPVNESIFEHTKLLFTSLIISYLIYYFIYKKQIDKTKYLSSLLVSILISITSMLMFYYIFKLITGKEIMFLAILSLLLGITIGQIVSKIMYKKNIKWSKEISLYSLITITLVYLLFTVNPPYLEFFYDSLNNGYGLNI